MRDRRWRAALIALGVVTVAIVSAIPGHHGGDIVAEMQVSERLLHGEPLYPSDLFPTGTVWAPFTAVALVPLALLARLSPLAATTVWSLLLFGGLALTIALAQRWGRRGVLLALAAVAVPLQLDFEYRNINTVLLLLLVAAAVDLEEGRQARAGLWLGLAAAAKAFPAFAFIYLSVRRQWRGLAVASTVAAVGTLASLIPYGPTGALETARAWLHLSLDPARWPLTLGNQSLHAVSTRLGLIPEVVIALQVLSVACTAVVVWRGAPALGALSGVAATTLLALLVSPLSWVHYRVLAIPAWMAVLARASVRPPTRAVAIALVLAGIGTSGVLTIAPRALKVAALESGSYFWGVLLLLIVLASPRLPRIAADPLPPRTP